MQRTATPGVTAELINPANLYEWKATIAGPAGTPYEGEDLVYLAEKPEQFFALCSRPLRALPGTCIQERPLDAAEITLRFSREWLQDWRNTAAGFDRLVAQLHAPGN